MHSHLRVHDSHFGFHWSPANVALTILLTLLFLVFVFLFMTLMAQPAYAQGQQNGIPATAREAAAMPQFAAKLAPQAQRRAMASQVPHPVQPRASFKNPRSGRANGQRGWLPEDSVIYDNGPINGNTDAWSINFSFAVSDTFTTNGSQITGLQFGAWLFPGDVLQSAEVLIGGAEYGNDLFDQVVSFTQSSNCTINTYGYAICTETATFNANAAAGTLWLTLQNAVVNNGDPLYWDENSGPSSASENSVGTIPSEAFTIEGGDSGPPPPPCFEYGVPSLAVLHNFSSGEGTPNGIVPGKNGDLYGTTYAGGDYGAGLVYRLALRGKDWLFNSLYSFVGGQSGIGPGQLMDGPEGALYGTATGGIQNCGQDGSSYCGLIFRVRPFPVACTTALCHWQEDAIYAFPGSESGGSPSLLSFGSAGNLYGTVALPAGATGVFQLSSSSGSWTETIIYTFAAGESPPSSLVAGADGNLYGATTTGGDLNCSRPYGCGIIFQLLHSGGSWTKNTLYVFHGGSDGGGPRSLHRDGFGNLYGVSRADGFTGRFYYTYDQVFNLAANASWTFSILYKLDYPGEDYATVIDTFTTDETGGFYFTDNQWTLYCDNNGCYPWYVWGEIVGGPPWRTYYWFNPGGIAARDGHVYGTTWDCGANGYGTIWMD